MPQRIDLDAALSPKRQAIDAKWSKKQRTLAGGACIALSAAALIAGGWWYMSSRPPRMPRSAKEAVAVLASSKFDNLDEMRKRQYAAEAARLLRDMNEEERRALLRDEENREAMRALREEMMDEAARKFARGEQLDMPWGRPPGDGERRQRPEGEEGQRPERPQLTEEERAAREKEMRERMTERVKTSIQTGNAQDGGLRAEFFKRMFSASGGQPGFRRPGGGRPGGGGNRGG